MACPSSANARRPRSMVASAPVAIVTLTLPEPDVSFGTAMVAAIPPVAGSTAVVAALVDGATALVFDCALGAGSGCGVGVAVGAGVGVVLVWGGSAVVPPPPPHAV